MSVKPLMVICAEQQAGIALLATPGRAGLRVDRLPGAADAFLVDPYFFVFLGVVLIGLVSIILWKTRRS